MKYSYEEKYKYMLSKLNITDLDIWEKDALLRMTPIFYQFSVHPEEKSFDEIIEQSIDYERMRKLNQNSTRNMTTVN